jgi:hypothetical protein
VLIHKALCSSVVEALLEEPVGKGRTAICLCPGWTSPAVFMEPLSSPMLCVERLLKFRGRAFAANHLEGCRRFLWWHFGPRQIKTALRII